MYQEAFPSNSKLWKVQTLWWIRNKRDVDKEEVADTMNQENHRPLVTDEPVEFWEMSTGWSSRLQKNHFRGIFRMCLKVITIYWKITRSQPDENWLDLETLGFWPIMPKNLPQHSTDRYSYQAWHASSHTLLSSCSQPWVNLEDKGGSGRPLSLMVTLIMCRTGSGSPGQTAVAPRRWHCIVLDVCN